MAFRKTDLDRVKRFALSIIELIEMHEDNDSDHESADTLEWIHSELDKISEEMSTLAEMVDWDATL